MQHASELHLVIVGDGPMRGELAALAEREGTASRVHFIATMPQAQLRHLYSAADVLLLPSTREGWPNVVLEALACGTPVVATDVGAVGEMLTDARLGRILPGRDAAALAAAVRSLCDAAPSREAVRQHAMRFDWASISRGQMQVFEQALAHAPHAALAAAAG